MSSSDDSTPPHESERKRRHRLAVEYYVQHPDVCRVSGRGFILATKPLPTPPPIICIPRAIWHAFVDRFGPRQSTDFPLPYAKGRGTYPCKWRQYGLTEYGVRDPSGSNNKRNRTPQYAEELKEILTGVDKELRMLKNDVKRLKAAVYAETKT